MVTREELYRLIWAMPMTKVSAQLGISYGKLVQICTAMGIPRPAQGHWTRLKLGKADPVPPLPAAAEGQPTTWTGDGMALPRARPAARAPRKKAITGNKTPPAMHTLLRGTKAQFLNSRPTRDDGFLRPYKRALPDLRTSSEALDRGLLLANALYNAFEEAGHHVVLSGLNSAARRLQIDPRETPIKGRQYDPYPQPWRPDRPTLVQTGGVSIGLIVLEMTEHVKMRYTNNGFVRDSPELAARLERSHGSGWTTFEDVPSGRLRIVAYAADSAVDWSQSWQESEAQTAPLSPNAIVKAVLAQKRQLSEMAEEAARRAEIRHRAWLCDRPVSPSPMRHFGKTQSGTGFGKAKPVTGYVRMQSPAAPQNVRFREPCLGQARCQKRSPRLALKSPFGCSRVKPMHALRYYKKGVP